MNREIKFEYGLTNHAPIVFDIREIEIGKPANICIREDCSIKYRRQYTGLKDIYGTEIYEGDILRVYDGSRESFHEVVWGGEDYPAFELEPHKWCEMNGLSFLKCAPDSGEYEVVGNIYENPELLKQEAK